MTRFKKELFYSADQWVRETKPELDQRFTWNGIGCSIDIEREDYPELTPDLVRELCASFILEKIGKSIEG